MRVTATIIMLTAAVGLAGCGSATTAASSSTSTTTAQPTPSETDFPDTYTETATADPTDTPTDDTATGLSLECGDIGTEQTYETLRAAWRDKAYDCHATISTPYVAAKSEAAAARAYEKSDYYYGEDGEVGALEDLLALCASNNAGVSALLEDRSSLPYALRICPKAPHAKLMRSVVAKDVFEDGDYTVGKDVKPGTYRTETDTKNCYWERTTKGGGTLANDFVTFAPKGVTVTIYGSDGGFASKECGLWTRAR